MTNHELGFRPSHFAALEACVHHEQRPLGPAADNGTRFHKQIANDLMTGIDLKDSKDQTNLGIRSWAITLVHDYAKIGWNALYVEKELTLAGPDGNTMTTGTVDLVLERDRHFLIIDWKTGENPRDYSAQLAGHIMALEELHLEAISTRALVAYVDLQQTIDHTQSYQESALRVSKLYKKWKVRGNEPYTINTYCCCCAIRGECPAWREQADYALASVDVLGTPEHLVSAKIDHLKNTPPDLEKFCIAYERLKTLVEEEWKLKSALKDHMETGYTAEHFILVNVKGKELREEIIDPEQYLQHVVKHLGTMKAAGAVKIDTAKARELWTAAMLAKPFPVNTKTLVTTKTGYSYIRAKK